MPLIYKIASAKLWREAESQGRFDGAPIDLKDGYIHFSTAEQAPETVALHFKGQDDLVIAAIDAEKLKDNLKWEPSRGGSLFPHLYGALPIKAVIWVKPLPMNADGSHDFSGIDL
ncbi:DUF952 domain-containing protein [Methyloferula stellata]|uniref:DUF952 domain-containing protein n=1 Tax=Methyloferula stellata TaxID=876270 RepID=UPI0003A6216D|nr:DUF952 domain-containing protein [Methyloferula stellata]